MEELFDFEALRANFRSGFRMLFDAMHGATGPHGRHMFEKRGRAREHSSQWRTSRRFRRHHPDPNLVYAADLVRRLAEEVPPDLGAVCDADGDRNMILGRKFF